MLNCNTVPKAVLDSLSNDVSPVQNGRLSAKIGLIYRENVKNCFCLKSV